MNKYFRFLMISAMYENGGNTTLRFLDGHPQMWVYPFESQLGTRLVQDYLTSLFPVKYRWPVFALDATSAQDYKSIIDEECKVRARTPHVSKFRHVPFDFSDDRRLNIYQRLVRASGRSRALNVEAFFRATFEAWKDVRSTGHEKVYVGYSPIIVVDAEKILAEMPAAHILHVVRNPWSAYADTRKRPVPMSLEDYMLGWTFNQYYALLAAKKYPDRMHILRTEDVMENPGKVLGALCGKLALKPDDSLKIPTWNGKPLKEIYPWGTIHKATPEANRATAKELSRAEEKEIRLRSASYLDIFNYANFI